MTNVWRVLAEFGEYTDEFVVGGYAGIGWIPEKDLSKIYEKGELRRLFRKAHPENTSPNFIGAQVGQVARFLLEIKPDDYIVTPTSNSALLRYGRVISVPYYESSPTDGCPYPHRRKVQWAQQPFNRKDLSPPFQNTLKFAQLTVSRIKHREEFLSIFIFPATPGGS